MVRWMWVAGLLCVGCVAAPEGGRDMPADAQTARDVEEVPDMAPDLPRDMAPPPLPTPCASWYPDEETRLAVAFSYGFRCGGCHGEDGEGTFFGPPLLGVVARRGAEEVVRVMQEGEGRMPGLGTERAEALEIVTWMRCLSEEE